jgi:hypothetical protein
MPEQWVQALDKKKVTRRTEMLIFSNRESESRTDAPVSRQEFPTDPARLTLATLERTPQATAAQWKVLQLDGDVDDAESMRALLPVLQASRPVLLYLHGYNNTPAACFERCDRLQSLYGLEIVRFSWSSRKYLHDEGCEPSGRVSGMGLDIPPDLAQLFGARHLSQTKENLRQLDRMASLDPLGPYCAWWLVMALADGPVH